MSKELGREGEKQSGIDVPLVVQVRAWYGSLVKGTLVTTARLPPRTIVLRRSQVKVDGRRVPGEPGPAGLADAADDGAEDGAEPPAEIKFSLEVCRAQLEPNEAKFSQLLVPLLEHAGGEPMVELMLRMQRDAAAEEQRLGGLVCSGAELTDEEAGEVQKLFEVYDAPRVTPADMMLAGMDTRDEHVRNKAIDVLQQRLNNVALGRFPIRDSHSLMGIPDPSGSIPEGEVCVLVKGAACVHDRLLVYKSPGLLPGDLRTPRAISPPAALLAHLDFGRSGQNAIIYSTRGGRSLADMTAGSDLDGDIFTVVYNAEILRLLPPADEPPWEKPARTAPPPPAVRPSVLKEDELQQVLLKHRFRCKDGDLVVSRAGSLWKALADEHGAGSREARQLGGTYFTALDSSKSPEPLQEVPHTPKDAPIYLKKPKKVLALLGGACRTGRVSALRRMYEFVSSAEAVLGAGSDIADRQTCALPWLDPQLEVRNPDGTPFESGDAYKAFNRARAMADMLERYRAKFAEMRRRHKGLGWAESAPWTDAMRSEFDTMIEGFRADFVDGRDVARPSASPDLLADAHALYSAVYRSQGKGCGLCKGCRGNRTGFRPRSFAFAWSVCGLQLLHIKEETRRLKRAPENPAPKPVDPARLLSRLKSSKRRRWASARAQPDPDDEPGGHDAEIYG